ncbi:amidohydrolase [Wenyingzhuangia fucanilytica]|uniref:Omega-amidase YafV n=1 Tax=Wenyingzhuangia fucanilytica TaxID=1790137 RepID=A0A1B1Y1Y9_9FLAO|nr:amidohydrolase [Wenyingzhuangia fucanilytica]ANW94773.1 amidohydrolase [Wenyingzhuangia fucanilytica]
MSDSLNITLVQTDIIWMNNLENLANLDKQLNDIKTDLIVLPEMFSTGFCLEPSKVAETMDGLSVLWMLKTAKKLNCAICGSLSIQEKNKYYNRFFFVTPSGIEATYDKKHLFSYGNENEAYTPGKKTTTINYKGWKIKPFVCYDLRFPVWSRNTNNYDLALYVANWPAKRSFPWNQLLTARAIENMSYVVAVNRIGIDGNDLKYQGDSKVIDPLGETLIDLKDSKTIKQINIKINHLDKVREKFGFLRDRDEFKLKD